MRRIKDWIRQHSPKHSPKQSRADLINTSTPHDDNHNENVKQQEQEAGNNNNHIHQEAKEYSKTVTVTNTKSSSKTGSSLAVRTPSDGSFKSVSGTLSPNAPPRQMLGYYLGPTLGQGHFGRVKVGVDKKSFNRVAMKMVVKAATDYNQDDVVKEANALMSLDHPNIIKCLSFQLDAKYPLGGDKFEDVSCIIFELAGAGQLFDFLKHSGGMDEAIARVYFKQLIEGVEECHRHGIVHRDLKLENLLLTDEFILKIADFGLCETGVLDSKATMDLSCGTTLYKAPVIHLKKRYTSQVDVFSCGVILFILASGHPPFHKATLEDSYYSPLANQDPDFFWDRHSRSVISSQLKELLQGMLCFDPEERYSIDQIKCSEWYNGKTLSSEELTEELHRRRLIVDEKGAVEPVLKKSVLSRLDSDPHRAFLDPNLSVEDTSMMTIDGPTLEDDQKAILPEVWDEDQGFAVYTRIRVICPSPRLLKTIQKLLASRKYRFRTIDDEWEIISTIPIPESMELGDVEELIVSFKIYQIEEDPNSNVIMVRRLQGGFLEFDRFFDEFCESLGI